MTENSSKVKIKICGLSRPEDIEAVNEARPDYCGFIIDVPKSSRNVSPSMVRQLVRGLHSEIVPVGVFVNAPLTLPAELLQDGTLGAVQLHGQEDETYIKALRKLTHRPVIQAFSMKSTADARRAQSSSADYILLDQGTGGSGAVFQWSLTETVTRPFFLAGGLKPENLKAAVEAVHPWAVDLSSGLETNGKKDRMKILDAVRIIRNI